MLFPSKLFLEGTRKYYVGILPTYFPGPSLKHEETQIRINSLGLKSIFLLDQVYCVTVISLIMTLINRYREEGKALNTPRWKGRAGTQIYHTLICSLLKKVQNQFFFQVLKNKLMNITGSKVTTGPG